MNKQQKTETLITKEQLEIEDALRPGNPEEVLVQGFDDSITREDMRTLRRRKWLLDKIINFYMELLMERSKEKKEPRVYAFNSFFYPLLRAHGYDAVKDWEIGVDLFQMDLVLVPVHENDHWTLAVIDMKKQQIMYYDSLLGTNKRCLQTLKEYLHSNSSDTVNFDLIHMNDIPMQLNCYDCSAFMCKFAEYLARGVDLDFTQDDMSRFRKEMVYEILHLRIL